MWIYRDKLEQLERKRKSLIGEIKKWKLIVEGTNAVPDRKSYEGYWRTRKLNQNVDHSRLIQIITHSKIATYWVKLRVWKPPWDRRSSYLGQGNCDYIDS